MSQKTRHLLLRDRETGRLRTPQPGAYARYDRKTKTILLTTTARGGETRRFSVREAMAEIARTGLNGRMEIARVIRERPAWAHLGGQ